MNVQEEIQEAFDSSLDDKVSEICDYMMVDERYFAAKYLEHVVVNGDGTLDYEVYPSSGTNHFVLVDEIDATSTSGKCGGVAGGPIKRMREIGFMVSDITVAMDGYIPYTVAGFNNNQKPNITGDNLFVFVKYYGQEHPVIEYWDEEDES